MVRRATTDYGVTPSPSSSSLQENDPWPGWDPYEPHPRGRIISYTPNCGALIRQRLEEDGVAVVQGVVPPHVCAELEGDMSAWLRKRGVDVHDNRTWSRFNNMHFTMSPNILGMMNTGSICFSKMPLKARCHPTVMDVYSSLYATKVDDMAMELGGVFWGFPPEEYPGGAITGQPTGGYYHWSEMWMHSDRGRDVKAQIRLQSTIQLSDAGPQDHCFAFLSGSHRLGDAFFSQSPPLALERKGSNTPSMTGASVRGSKDGFVQLTYDDVAYFVDRGCKWTKAVAPKGSVIIWDGRLIHSTVKPTRGRSPPKPRFLVYGGLIPKQLLTDEDYSKRCHRAKAECRGETQRDVQRMCQDHPLMERLLAIDGPSSPPPPPPQQGGGRGGGEWQAMMMQQQQGRGGGRHHHHHHQPAPSPSPQAPSWSSSQHQRQQQQQQQPSPSPSPPAAAPHPSTTTTTTATVHHHHYYNIISTPVVTAAAAAPLPPPSTPLNITSSTSSTGGTRPLLPVAPPPTTTTSMLHHHHPPPTTAASMLHHHHHPPPPPPRPPLPHHHYYQQPWMTTTTQGGGGGGGGGGVGSFLVATEDRALLGLLELKKRSRDDGDGAIVAGGGGGDDGRHHHHHHDDDGSSHRRHHNHYSAATASPSPACLMLEKELVAPPSSSLHSKRVCCRAIVHL